MVSSFFLTDFHFQPGGKQEDKRKSSEAKNTSELEKTIRKLTEENRRLLADLNDEKAKVLALADMREEDEGLDLSEPPTPKKSRRFSAKRKGKPPADLEEPAPAKSPAAKKAPRTPKAKSTPASKPKADVAEVSSVSKRGRQSKKVAYEEIDISPVEQEEEEEEEIVEEEMPPLIPKKGKGKNNKSVKNSKKEEPEKKAEIPVELPPAIKTKGKGKGSKKTAVSIVEPKDLLIKEIPLEQPKSKGKKKKEEKVAPEIIAEPLPPPSKASKGKRVKIMENEPVPEVQPKLNKKSQKKSQPPPPPPPVAQNKKGGIKRKASDSSENVKPPAAKKGRKR